MKNLKFAIWIFLLWLFQTVFLRFIRIGGIAPEMLYVFVLCMALNEKKPAYYISIGIICGFISDAFTGGTPGLYLLIYTCTVLAVAGIGEVIYREPVFMIVPVVLLFSFLENTLYFFVNHGALQSVAYVSALKSIILPVMLYNTVLAVILNPILKLTVYPKKRLRRR
jgi:rod shape-determining protein MreD